MYEHKNHLVQGFTEKYNVQLLVHIEQTNDIQSALQREKQLKKWNRKWKLDLIEKMNPDWKDVSENWIPDSSGMTTSLDKVGQLRGKQEKVLNQKLVKK